MPQINQAGLNLIKEFEGCSLESYQDSGGIWTIGYGHTGPTIVSGQSVTQSVAEQYLRDDLQKFEWGVNNLCAHPLNANQFSALVCFAYNVGLEALADSTLMRLVNAGNYGEAAQQFQHWVYCNGQVLPGLVARRTAERELFCTGVTNG